MSDPTERKRLSPAAENPETGRMDPSSLSEHQKALRRAMMDAFAAKKARRFIERHVNHININRDLVEGILLELNNRLIKIREIEDHALETLSRAGPEE